MLISIVVPSFNQAAFLERTLQSIINQDYQNKEIFVIDGGSTDGSIEIIRRYADRLTYWISERDAGQADAIVKGTRCCNGQLIGWINSDDILLPKALTRIAKIAARINTPEGVFYGGHNIIDENDRVMDIFPSFNDLDWCRRRLGPVICQPGTFYSRDAYERVGGIDTSLQYGMDLDLWLRLFEAGVPFIRVGGYLASFRRHSLQKGHNKTYLDKCDSEEKLLRRRYELATPGSLSYSLARTIRRSLGVLTGAMLITLIYRLLARRTFREYHPNYS